MLWSASAITTVSSDTEPTIVVQFESGKYVFNAGENTGRAWLQSKTKFAKTKAIFLTQNGTQRGSGLPGLMMFLADSGSKCLDVVGPQGFTHFLATMRSYLWRDGMHVTVTEAEDSQVASSSSKPTPLYHDQNVDVYAIPLFASTSSLEASIEPSGNKRRRSLSPRSDLVAKKPHYEGSEVGLSSPKPSTPNSVVIQALSSSFAPSALVGADGHIWRQMIVENMFPVKTPRSPPPPVYKEPTMLKRRSKTSSDTPVYTPPPRTFQSGNHAQVLTHRDRLLPRFQSKVPQPCLCYIVVGPAVRGKFDAKKANALGVPNGPVRGKLTAGQSVTFKVDDGNGGKIEKTVHSEEIMGPSDPPHVVMILDIPSVDHIQSLVTAFDESPFYSRLRSQDEESKKEHVVQALFHLCGRDVLENDVYKAFMNGFPSTTHHIVASRQHAPDPVTFTSAAANQIALSKLDADMFPGHSYRLNALKDLSSIPSLPSNIHLLRSSLNVEVRPPREPTVDQATLDSDRFHPIATGERSLYLPDEVGKAFKKAGADAAALPRRSPRSYDGVTIVPLGTSSALPSKYRNVSSTLVQIPGHGNILLDCGEGTWGQLARAFGSDDMSAGAWQVLRDLKCIFLSHIHGDHHIGLAKVLAMRKQLNPPPKEPLYVVGIRSLHLYLHELSDLEDLGLNDPITGVVLLLSDSLNFRGPNIARYGRWQLKDDEDWMDNERSIALNKDLCALLGLSAFTTVDVDHRTRCYGLVLDHNEKWRLVFSGDTKPTQNLVQAGKNATVLIHEATMGDDQEELAAQKAHSTVGQAISIGTDMKASNIMLTHFSARYPKMPPAIVNKSDSKTNVVLAFDHARVRFGDMMKLRTYLPALEAFYGEVAVDDDDNDEGITTLLVESNVPDA